MSERTAEEEIAFLREELAKAHAVNAQLQAEIEQLRAIIGSSGSGNAAGGSGGSPSFVKPSTAKAKDKDKAQKEPRRKRAKDQNGTRKRDVPTRTVQHRLEQCPDCAYPLRHPTLAKRRQVIEL